MARDTSLPLYLSIEHLVLQVREEEEQRVCLRGHVAPASSTRPIRPGIAPRRRLVGRGWPRLAEAGCMRLGAAPGILWRWWSLLGATLAGAGPPWFRQSGVRAAAGQV